MAKIGLEGSATNDTIASNHINYRKYEQTGSYPNYDQWGNYIGSTPTYGYNNYQTNATVKGVAKSTVTNVKINGKSPIVVGDRITENDSYSLPSGGEYVSGAHTNTQGTVTVGNTKNVKANGKLIAVGGSSSVTTHASGTAQLSTGLSTTVNIG